MAVVFCLLFWFVIESNLKQHVQLLNGAYESADCSFFIYNRVSGLWLKLACKTSTDKKLLPVFQNWFRLEIWLVKIAGHSMISVFHVDDTMFGYIYNIYMCFTMSLYLTILHIPADSGAV